MSVEQGRLLLIDTCGAIGLVGLSEGERVLAERELPGRAASAQIGPAVRELLAERGWRVSDLQGIGVVGGPGSFTGLRTGLAFAKGLCEAAGLPLALVSRLAVLARAAGLEDGVAVLDAGREGFYVRLQNGPGSRREWMSEPEELTRTAQAMRVVVAEPRVAERLAVLGPEFRSLCLADALAPAWDCLEEGGADVARSDANYVRRESEIYRKPSQADAVSAVRE